jgi:hypothetical protein
MYHSIGKTHAESRWSPAVKKPSSDKVVIGFDEWDKEERKVRYRSDSNRFFDHPYTGAVYPSDRMHKWRENE